MPLVSISNAQRAPIPDANFVGTVYHGLPRDLTPTLASARRLPRVPRAHIAGEARRPRDRDRPCRGPAVEDRRQGRPRRRGLLPVGDRAPADRPGIEFIGEIDERRKTSFLGEARALLFPIDWPEPFGLAMIEAMACGTPVLAFQNGSVPEVIDDGVTGYVVDTVDEAICALGAVLALDRGRVRRRFEERFTASRMARDYVKVYEHLLGSSDARLEEISMTPRAAKTNGAGEVAR